MIPAIRGDIVPFERAAPALGNVAFNGTHQVRQGDTLWSLARSFNIDVELLAEVNGMQITDVLREGRVINTPIR
jgi:membrane-bound lytic murein transglycosylase D